MDAEVITIDDEKVDLIKARLISLGKVKFQLYALDYIIELIDSKYIIYPEQYAKKNIKEYDSLEDILNLYYVYNENLLSNLNEINIIN